MCTSHSKKQSECHLWLLTQIVDYGICGFQCYVLHLLHDGEGRYGPLMLGLVMAVQGTVAGLLLYIRERIHFAILGARIAAEKCQPLTSRNISYIFQNVAFSHILFYLMTTFEYAYYKRFELSFRFWIHVFSQFYAMLVLRDVFFLAPFHRLMHENWYSVHKTHHEVRKELQAMHAFHIDLLDLVLENSGAPALLMMGQYVLGFRVGFHWFAPALLAFHDAALHSVNPYSAMYFNPLLDHICKPNVYHQLHHAVNNGYLLFVPFHHIFRSLRKADTDKYNKVFNTNFNL